MTKFNSRLLHSPRDARMMLKPRSRALEKIISPEINPCAMLFHCATRCHRGAAARLFTNTLTPRPVDKSLLNGNTAAAFAPREINRSPMLDVVATGPCHRPVLIESSTDECLSAIIRYTCRDKRISLETNRRDERFRTTLNVSFGSGDGRMVVLLFIAFEHGCTCLPTCLSFRSLGQLDQAEGLLINELSFKFVLMCDVALFINQHPGYQLIDSI